jgi:precorrin-6B methylase 2/protein tyrosine phosphatase (PTP) superfamily phosphohydrolase (DUF442 family)
MWPNQSLSQKIPQLKPAMTVNLTLGPEFPASSSCSSLNYSIFTGLLAWLTLLIFSGCDAGRPVSDQQSPTSPNLSSSVAATATLPFDFSESTGNQILPVELGDIHRVHRYENLILSGQFSPEDLSLIKELGIEKIVSLRTPQELDWNEKSAVESAGLEYLEFPFLTPESLTDEIFEQVCVLFRDSMGKMLIHCGGADRVGAVWLVHRVLSDGLSVEQAEVEAAEVGLKTAAYREKALAYLAQKQQDSPPQDPPREEAPPLVIPDKSLLPDRQEKSVVPGINESFLDPDLSPDEYVERFEIESREIYGSRMHVLKACKLENGMRIADIGAGTGIFSRLFANQVGETGWVYAIDIAPRFLEHINRQSRQFKQQNVSTILCQEDAIGLPPDSIDFAFICDTYHHFEYPQSTLSSIYAALKPGGRMVVIDFIRIEGISRPWVMGHVRAGEEVFTSEIEQAGFQLQEKVQIPGFEENYFLIFSK